MHVSPIQTIFFSERVGELSTLQDMSNALLNDPSLANTRHKASSAIASAEELLRSLGKGNEEVASHKDKQKLNLHPKQQSWEDIVQQANEKYPDEVVVEDFMSPEEIASAERELDEINDEFSHQTNIINKIDLSFLSIATALQVTKSLLFPYVAAKFDYGKGFDPNQRPAHNDKSIEKEHREANDNYRDKKLSENGGKTGYWINILYQTPPYDITRGAPAAGLQLHGGEHRLYTLGHDPVLGWIFGTANILTDTLTTNSYQSRRVQRKPEMMILPGEVSPVSILQESIKTIKADRLNLPAAIFAEAQHLKSDEYTKAGLPVPILSTINEEFASKLYKEHYDALCLARDIKITGASFAVSAIIDMIIGLTHGLFRDNSIPKDLYEVRTRKILLISNSVASTSSIINAAITQNPKNLDIGGLLNTVGHLFRDIRFITKIKQEYIESQIRSKLQVELDKVDQLYNNI